MRAECLVLGLANSCFSINARRCCKCLGRCVFGGERGRKITLALGLESLAIQKEKTYQENWFKEQVLYSLSDVEFEVQGKCVRFQGRIMYDPHSTGPYFSLSVQIMISLASVLCFSASGISDKAEVSRAHPFRSASDFAVSDQALYPMSSKLV